jgi:hypothetical protein
MLSWIIQITIISTVLIILVHYLINFFKSTLTVPKIKDLVNTPTQKYESMYNVINQKSESSPPPSPSSSDSYTLIDLLPTKEAPTMKNELKDFLKKQLHTSSSVGSSVEPSLGSMDSFSTY